MRKRTLVFLMAVCFFAKPLFADESQLIQMIQSLQNQMAEMQKTMERQNAKIHELEIKGVQEIPSQQAGVPGAPMSDGEFSQRLEKALGGSNLWLKDLKFAADLRLRADFMQFTSGNTSETDDRNRFRMRLRFGFEKPLPADMKVGFSLNSAESGTGNDTGLSVDPVSQNQSFDSLFSYKDIFIEKAFASYTPSWAKTDLLQKTEVTAGKFANPFEKGSSEMVWDRDVRPEGIYEKQDLMLLDGDSFDLNSYVTAGQFVLQESAATRGDAELFAYQLGIAPSLQTSLFKKPVSLNSAVSYYNYSNYAVNNNFLIGGTSQAKGNMNALDGLPTDLDARDFDIWEFYNEFTIYPIETLPVRPYFDFAQNIADQSISSNDDSAYALGIKLGEAVKRHGWELSGAYKRLESESLAGAFTDSDFGLGGTGKRGSVFKAGYALTDNLTLWSALFLVNNLNTDTGGVRDEEQRRFILDLVWKF